MNTCVCYFLGFELQDGSLPWLIIEQDSWSAAMASHQPETHGVQGASKATFQRPAWTTSSISNVIHTNRLAIVRSDVPKCGTDYFVFGGFRFS